MSAPDLLIIGAGPVGLTLACEARRHGMSVRIIDKLLTPSIHSKAQIVHARTMEILDDMEVADRFAAEGIPIHSFKVFSAQAEKPLVQIVVAGIDSHYQGILSISQHQTELILAARLRELGVEIERGVTLEAFEQDEGGVTATLTNGDSEETLVVPWLVGCDGAHSTVRHTLELPFEGDRYPLHVIQADARVELPIPVADDEVIAFVGNGAIGGLFPLPGGTHRYRFLVPRKDDDDLEPTLAHFQAALDELAPSGAVVSDPAWMVGFRIHCRLVPHFRVGRVFLAGDAGHIHSPAGGQGMNMGMQDAYNLAWKLALRHRGEGTEALLDSYSAERHPVAAATLGWTDRATRGGLVNLGLENRMAIKARNRLASFVGNLGLVQQRVARVMSMVDVGYDGSPICGEARGSVLSTNVTFEPTSESPTVGAWYAFSGGPKPGQRAPDATVEPHAPEALRMHELFRGTAHTLLLFDGAAATQAGYEALSAIARAVVDRYGDRIRPHVLVPAETRPASLDFDGSVVLDPQRRLHDAYGASTECLYLVRPDGHVGFRSQPAALEPLLRHLGDIFT